MPTPDPRWSEETRKLADDAARRWLISSTMATAAEFLLGALADAGLLVEPDSETREEWGYRWPDGQVVPAESAAHTVNATAVQRTIRIGPWREPQ